MTLMIRDLEVKVAEKSILRGLSLTANPGEVHAIMGPNGSGKSTLAGVLAGREEYGVVAGQAMYQGEDLLSLAVHERAYKGLFLGFQYPVAIPGLSTMAFLQAAVNAKRAQLAEEPLDAYDFLEKVKGLAKQVGLSEAFLKRDLNDEFSGGEKKRNEVLQMLLLEPSLAVLDEMDSGLDVDALKVVAEGVKAHRRDDRIVVLITHYQRLLDYIVPDVVHVLYQGRIIHQGDASLAQAIESRGYQWLIDQVPCE